MSYTRANYEDVGSKGGGLHFLRDELNCENLGITVIDAEPGWEGMEHDHEDAGQEEVYLVVEGEVSLQVENEVLQLEEGDAVRVSPDQSRKMTNDENPAKVVAVGAP